MSRRKGRVLAFQALYSYDIGGEKPEDLLKFNWDDSDDNVDTKETDSDEYNFARLLFSGTIEHLEEVDSLIKKHLAANWDFDRVNKVSLAILRMSTYSLLFQKETGASIVIDEAVGIAKEYGADDSFKFINAILDKINKTASETVAE